MSDSELSPAMQAARRTEDRIEALEAEVKAYREALEQIAQCNVSINGLIARTALDAIGAPS